MTPASVGVVTFRLHAEGVRDQALLDSINALSASSA
jgi:hypothetical protein